MASLGGVPDFYVPQWGQQDGTDTLQLRLASFALVPETSRARWKGFVGVL